MCLKLFLNLPLPGMFKRYNLTHKDAKVQKLYKIIRLIKLMVSFKKVLFKLYELVLCDKHLRLKTL